MDKSIIRMKCDRILLDKQLVFSQILNNRIQQVYEHHADTLGAKINYSLLTDFTSEILTAYTGAISEIMVEIIQEVLSDNVFDNLEDLD